MKHMSIKAFLLSWVLPKDRETLETWLALLEATKLILALLFIVSLFYTLLQADLTKIIRCTLFSILTFIFLWFLVAVQYLMAIEYNTRKDRK